MNAWTPEAHARLRMLYRQGQTLRAIGIIMGRSTGSISGQVKTLKLKRTTPKKTHAYYRIRKPAPIVSDHTCGQEGLPVEALQAGQCRYPYGVYPPYQFCGAVCRSGPYCPKHAEICYRQHDREGYTNE